MKKNSSVSVATELTDLKKMILSQQLRHPPSQTELNSYVLYLNGKELADDQSVGQLSISPSSEISCVKRSRSITVVFNRKEQYISVDSMSRVKDITVTFIVLL